MAVPIWKDYIVTLSSSDAVQYRIKCEGDVIYNGRAYPLPGQSNIAIRMNDVCANLLEYNISGGFTPTSNPRTFTLETFSGAAWVQQHSVQFFNDWSYDYGYSSAQGRAFPAGSYVSPIQDIIFSAESNQSIVLEFENGTSSTITKSPSNGVIRFSLASYSGLKAVTYAGKRHEVRGCIRYVVYYVNAYGGWDTLAIAGNATESVSYEAHSIKTESNNQYSVNRSEKVYLNDADVRASLNTGWLDDLGSSRIKHLIGSTMVYLCDLDRGLTFPAIVRNAEAVAKTYKGEGRTPVNQIIELSVAQERYRG